MTRKLYLAVCEAFAAEAKSVLSADDFADVDITILPQTCCMAGELRLDQRDQALLKLDELCHDQEIQVVVIGASCLASATGLARALRCARLYRLDQCLYLLADRALVDRHLQEGAYLLTPTWLTGWRQQLERWGFDQETARAFFAESATSLVLLDTGIVPDSQDELRAFAEYLALPASRLPIGLDHLRLSLTRIVLEWRLENARRASAAAVAEAHRQLADYETLFDLIGTLAGARSEQEATAGIVELFTMLLAPGRLVYIPVVDGQTLYPPLQASPADSDLCRALMASSEEYIDTPSGRGFALRISHGGQMEGILIADAIALPEYHTRYLSLALILAKVCGLAIANARTYQRLAEDRVMLQQQAEDLLARNQELDAFAHTVAHDLKNPLAAMVGFADALLSSFTFLTEQELQKYLTRISEAGQKAINIVDELLLLAETRKQDVRLEPLDMALIVASAQGRVQMLLDERKGMLIAPEQWPTAWGYGPWVEEVWVNYLSNALRYGGTPPVVEMGATLQPDGQMRFWVRDNGPGLSPEQQARLFVPFTRLEQARTTGHGLGLSIVRRIVEKLGGRVGVESTGIPGEGCTFFFTLPTGPLE